MKKAIKIINELVEQGVIENYAIGGGIAAIFYIEPILTYDLHIFVIPKKEGATGLLGLSPIYDYLRDKGYSPQMEYMMIENIPVQFLPVYNELVTEAVNDANITKYEEIETRVIKPEHLIAIMLDKYRPKDRERLIKFMDEADYDRHILEKILEKFRLKEKFEKFISLYHE